MLAKRHAWNRIALATALTVCASGGSTYQVFAQQPAAAAAAAPAAPKYKAIPVPEAYKSDKAIKELEDAKKAAFRGSFSTAAVSNHYKNVLLPRLTNVEDPQLANAAAVAMRQDLVDAQKLTPDNLKELNKELLRYFSIIEAGNQYTPAARINATLLIGELFDERATNSAPAKLSPAAFTYLIKEIDKAPNDGIKAAMLVGIERHISVYKESWNDQFRSGLAGKLLALAMAPSPPTQTAESHAYLSARYLQLLRMFKHDKDAAAVAFATDALANEFTHPILREEALEVVGQYSIPDEQQAKLVAAGRYSMRYMKQRLEHWNDLNSLSVTAGGGGGGGRGMGPGASYGGGYAASGGPGGMSGAGAAGPGAMYGLGPKKEDKKAEKKPWEKQDEETRMLRRFMHEIVQNMRFGLSGTTKNEVPDEFKNGLLSKIPEGEERDLLVHAVGLMEELQDALNDEEIEKKTDFNLKEIGKKVDNLIAIAEQYPGAVDLENEAIVIEDETPDEAPTDETVDASEPVDPTVAVTPAEPAADADNPGQ